MVLRERPPPLRRSATWLGVALATTTALSAVGSSLPTYRPITEEAGFGGVRATNGRPSRALSATGSSSSSSSSSGGSSGSSSPSSSETLVCHGTPSLIDNQECDDINNNEYCG